MVSKICARSSRKLEGEASTRHLFFFICIHKKCVFLLFLHIKLQIGLERKSWPVYLFSGYPMTTPEAQKHLLFVPICLVVVKILLAVGVLPHEHEYLYQILWQSSSHYSLGATSLRRVDPSIFDPLVLGWSQ